MNPDDRNSQVWRRLRTHIWSRIERLRDQMEVTKDDRQVAALQGRIRELRDLVAHVEPSLKEETGQNQNITLSSGLY